MITTDLSYPEGLPWPTRDGYTTQHGQPFQRTALTSGRARQRRRFSNVPSEYNVNFVFTRANEAELFEAWFRYTINDGASWFNMKLKTPLGLGDYVCRFVEMYEGPDIFGTCAWKVSAKLELWERPTIPAEFAEFPDYVLEADIFDIAMNKLWPLA